MLKRSVQFAFENPESSSDYVSQNAQAMNSEVAKQHIKLYVNEYSVDLGKTGREAVEILVNKAVDLKIIPSITKDIFVENRIWLLLQVQQVLLVIMLVIIYLLKTWKIFGDSISSLLFRLKLKLWIMLFLH